MHMGYSILPMGPSREDADGLIIAVNLLLVFIGPEKLFEKLVDYFLIMIFTIILIKQL